MAYNPTLNVQFDGDRKYIHVFNIDNSGDTSSGTTILNVSDFNPNKNGASCNRISLNKIWYNISPTSVNDGATLQWENSGGDETFLTLIGYDDYDFSSIGGLVNPNTSGTANGDVNIVIPTHIAGDTYSIVSEWIKYYA